MTIAACYLSNEGIVFGSDSTTTITQTGQVDGSIHRYYDHAQKIFQIGETSTLGIVMWGMGSLPGLSFRTMLSEYAQALRTEPQRPDALSVAQRWSDFFWEEYTNNLPIVVARAQELHKKFEEKAATAEEEIELVQLLQDYSGGFCLGGNLDHAKRPQAYEIAYRPWLLQSPTPTPLEVGRARFWGCPNIIERILFGVDSDLFGDISKSGHWNGTPDQLYELMAPYVLQQQTLLPIREAIDWVYSSIYCTIKAMKYSQLARVCGGPIEIAVITSDRPFRWVRHKSLGAAIKESGVQDA